MDNKKQKLELTWIGKDEELRLEPRILIEDSAKSYGDPSTENMLIHGDNLLALKALEQDFADKIACVYIDPPYNTGSAFEHYDDNLEHSTWLNLMKPRLEILKTLLHPLSGSIWISIDDDESHYLKVLCDEIFGRSNFVANVVWQKKNVVQNDARFLSKSHDHILVYAKDLNAFSLNLLPRTDEMDARYDNPDNDPRGVWQSVALQAKSGSAASLYEIEFPNGVKWKPVNGTFARLSKGSLLKAYEEGRLWFGKDGKNVPRLKKYLSEVKQGLVASTIFKIDEVGSTQESKTEIKKLFNDDPFDTPKPERLMQRIITLASNPGAWVLDSFLGSGTTSAVAHKMNRKWIGIEFGNHATTHCLPRLKSVVDGTDGLKLSEDLGWKGGGGFKFYELAPSLLRQDKFGNWVIEEKYNAHMLAAAIAKQEGFRFLPDQETFWKQATSTERDFLYTTTQFLTPEVLDGIHAEMKPDETLLIVCKAYFENCAGKYPNISIKKIPQSLLGRCEYGKDNYDLNIIEETADASADEIDAKKDTIEPPQRNKKSTTPRML